MEAIYIIADHTRCLAFMIADGIIPSNVKEGYLARLVLRRTIRFMKDLDMKESLADVMAIQLDFLSKFYPEIRDSEEHIMNIIKLEEERYAATVKKGKSIVRRSIKRLKKEGKSEMPLEMLIDLYDAHGIPPETVVEMAGDDFTVNVPDNFFTQVAGAHEKDISLKPTCCSIKISTRKSSRPKFWVWLKRMGTNVLSSIKQYFTLKEEVNLQTLVKFPLTEIHLKCIMPKRLTM